MILMIRSSHNMRIKTPYMNKNVIISNYNHQNLADVMGWVRIAEFGMKACWIFFYSAVKFSYVIQQYSTVQYILTGTGCFFLEQRNHSRKLETSRPRHVPRKSRVNHREKIRPRIQQGRPFLLCIHVPTHWPLETKLPAQAYVTVDQYQPQSVNFSFFVGVFLLD